MHEKTLLKISLIGAILGVIALFLISKTAKLSEGTLMEENKDYVIHGAIKRINQRDAVTFIDLAREDELTVVLFKDYPVDLHQGDYIEAYGQASKDKNGELQLLAKEIRVIK